VSARAIRHVVAALVVVLAGTAVRAEAGVFAGYSQLRVDGDDARGGALALRRPLFGGLKLDVELTAHQGDVGGDSLREITLMAGPVLQAGGGRFRPFAHALLGVAHTRQQVEIFGIAIGPDGVCNGSCGGKLGPALSAGAGLDWGLGSRLSLRLPQVDYVLVRMGGQTVHRLRGSAGIVWGGR
jgi:hypothetical protein